MIYTLGCSFTKWYWPTWSDWLDKYQGPVTNWAYNGNGNNHIYWVLLDRIDQITTDDHIMIMWSGSSRLTQWYDQEWIDQYDAEGFFPKTDGKLWFTENTPWLGMYKVHPDHDVSLSQMIIGNFQTILQTQLLLDSIGCKYTMMFWQNPWMDVRPNYKPKFSYTWDKSNSITKQEIENAYKITEIRPVQNVLNKIKWNNFVEVPTDPFDPTTFNGLWEYFLSNKEYSMLKNIHDNHPVALVHHDYLIEKILKNDKLTSKYRSMAKDISQYCIDMIIPKPTPTDYVGSPDSRLNKFTIEDNKWIIK
jgi:hypothetical protein